MWPLSEQLELYQPLSNLSGNKQISSLTGCNYRKQLHPLQFCTTQTWHHKSIKSALCQHVGLGQACAQSTKKLTLELLQQPSNTSSIWCRKIAEAALESLSWCFAHTPGQDPNADTNQHCHSATASFIHCTYACPQPTSSHTHTQHTATLLTACRH